MPEPVLILLLWSCCTNLHTSNGCFHVFQLDGTKVLHSQLNIGGESWGRWYCASAKNNGNSYEDDNDDDGDDDGGGGGDNDDISGFFVYEDPGRHAPISHQL